MMTGMEIRNQQFGKSIRGYNEDEVRNFLQQVAQDYENLYSENSLLKESVQRGKFELEKYRNIEETMNSSLILAQHTAETLKVNAQKEAEMMLADSKHSVVEMMTGYQEILKHLQMFSIEIKSQLNTELELVERNMQKNEELARFFKAPDVKALLANLNQLKQAESE